MVFFSYRNRKSFYNIELLTRNCNNLNCLSNINIQLIGLITTTYDKALI